jgi:DNA-binding CsgD family transcriptional regulator/transcriptional regulator with XRE-family HTH domain
VATVDQQSRTQLSTGGDGEGPPDAGADPLSVRHRRRASGLTLDQAARLIGISASQLSRIERGRSTPSAGTEARLRLFTTGGGLTVGPGVGAAADRGLALVPALEAWPLAGRDAELARFESALGRPGGAGLILVGPNGVGKTRLAREALARAEARGCAAWWLAGLAGAAPAPLGVFAHLVAVPDAARSDRAVQAATAQLLSTAAGRRVVLVMDDAHALDDGSAALIHRLVTAGDAFLLATLRSGQPAPAPISALWKDGRVERLVLRPLDPVTTQELLRRALRGAVEIRTAQALWGASRGNPLLLRELALEGLESGRLSHRDGVWRWTGHLGLGGRLREVVEDRGEPLSRAELEALELVAVGERLDLRVVDTLVPESVLVSLESRRLIDVEAGPSDGEARVRVADPLWAEALRARSPIRARALKRRLARALEAARPLRPDDLLRLAGWKLDAGDPASPELLLDAARRAEARFDHAAAQRFAEAALQAGGSEARLLIAQALAGQGRGAEAEEVLARLPEPEDDDGLVRRAEVRAGNLLLNLGRADEAVAVVAGAEDGAGRGRAHELTALRACALASTPRRDEALRAARSVLARPGATDLARLWAGAAAAAVWLSRGQFGRLFEALEEGIPLAQRFRDSRPLIEVCLSGYRWRGLVGSGEIGRAASLAAEHFRHALSAGLEDAAAHWAVLVGCSELLHGQVRTATRTLTEGMPLISEHDRLGHASLASALLAQAAAQAGELTIAAAALSAAERRPGPMGSAELAGVHRHLARAWLAAAGGDLHAARSCALAAASVARAAGELTLESQALHDHARLGHASRVAERLAELAAGTDGRLHRTFAAHAAALQRDDGPALDQVSGAFASMGAALLAAEAAADAARAHRRAGLRGRSQRSRRLARELVAGCEGAWTPALALLSSEEADVVLTPREMEIGMLAARDVSSAAIADRLGISVRTVDNHLARVYGKLDIGSRQELRRLLFGRPPGVMGPGA